jgi:hypothetical protein
MDMKFKWQNILILLGLFIAVILLIDFNRRMEELGRLDTKLKSVRAEGTAIMQTQEVLLTKVAYATSDGAVETWVHGNGWTRDGEKPIALVSSSGSVTPTPEPQVIPQTESLPNWRIWWELFFGGN